MSILAEVIEPKGPRIADQQAENSTSPREIADRSLGLGVELDSIEDPDAEPTAIAAE